MILLLASRPKFLVASAAPILVGSALGYATAGVFQPLLFLLALLAIMFLHAGANMANDYFDHVSGNDWVNRTPTPFSGGSRYIQQGILSPKATLITALVPRPSDLATAALANLSSHCYLACFPYTARTICRQQALIFFRSCPLV
jgi:1,4-dihydroxy-2-naphthoate octaprenyltransferase